MGRHERYRHQPPHRGYSRQPAVIIRSMSRCSQTTPGVPWSDREHGEEAKLPLSENITEKIIVLVGALTSQRLRLLLALISTCRSVSVPHPTCSPQGGEKNMDESGRGSDGCHLKCQCGCNQHVHIRKCLYSGPNIYILYIYVYSLL